MRAVVQRVSRAEVAVGERVTGAIGPGVLVLVGVSLDDEEQEAEWLAGKVAGLRIFGDDEEKMNRSLADVGGEALVVSQFTLLGDARKGRRPSFVRAASGPRAEAGYEAVVKALRARGIRCATGEFGAAMQVSLTNEGPVTILLDSEKTF